MIRVLVELALLGAIGAGFYWQGRAHSMRKVLLWLQENEPGAFKRLSADIMGEPVPLSPQRGRVAGQRRRSSAPLMETLAISGQRPTSETRAGVRSHPSDSG